jgi:two-component system nitrate/nitrite sensor histidine kinase NarX
MGIAAGIGILAALNHGLVGFVRRPVDRARVAFAVAAAAAAAGALSVLALYAITDISVHVAVMKWAYFPATVVWTVAIVWFVAYIGDVRPRPFLIALTAGFAFTLVVNFVLPRGLLHEQEGGLMEMESMGGSVMVMTNSSPHVLQNVTDALTLIAFAFLCYAVYRVSRRPTPVRAGYLGLMTGLLAVATLIDAIIEHRVLISVNTFYLSQVSFAVVIIAVSLALRRESLRVERELQVYRTRMDDLVDARVHELDEAYALLELEAEERRATEGALRRREEELDALQRMAQVLAGRATLAEALDEATAAIAGVFKARYARVRLLTGDDHGDQDADGQTAAMGAAAAGDEGPAALSALDLAVTSRAMRGGAMISEDVALWPDQPLDVRRRAAEEGLGHILAAPLTGTSGPAGALVIARDASAGRFTAQEQQLARTAGEALAAVIEIDRLYRQAQRQAAAEERQALARDLHDAVTQSIYSASLIAEALPAVWERDPAEGAHNLERLRRLVRAALAEMRTLLFELRPAALETAPLDSLLQRLGDALGGQMQVDIAVEVDPSVDLPHDVKIAFYRVTQEAFSNIAKHARADNVSARVLAVDGVATLIVRDDGRGFDVDAVPSGGHMGLRIMDERLQHVAGTLTVESSLGGGTTIRAAWPSTASAERPLERMGA